MRRRDFLHLSGMPLLVSALSASRARVQNAAPGPVVETAAGRLRGRAREGVVTFKGIRYGASTAGVNRFQPPVRPQPSTGIVDAFEYGPRAWQPFRPMIPEIGDALTGSGPMDEDCLRLNVWTPAIDRGRRPVMVWFHGGGQRTGPATRSSTTAPSSRESTTSLSSRITHRLNALGYLWLAGLPGISERFARLGEPRRCAISCSRSNGCATTSRSSAATPATSRSSASRAAAAKSAMLTGFPAAKGLFHRAIIMSTLADTAVTGLEPARAVEAAELLLAASRRESRRRRAAAVDAGRADRRGADGGAGRAGGQGGQAATGGHLTALRAGRRRHDAARASVRAWRLRRSRPTIPIMIGSNECEGIPYGNPTIAYWTREPANEAELRAEVKRLVPVRRCRRGSTDRAVSLTSPGDITRRSRGGHGRRQLAAPRTPAYLDRASASSHKGSAPVFLYTSTGAPPSVSGKLRSMHCMELPFVFDHPDAISFMTGRGRSLCAGAAMSEAWVAFARTGNPNHAGIPSWAPYEPTAWPTMVFGPQVALFNDPHGEERRAIEAVKG